MNHMKWPLLFIAAFLCLTIEISGQTLDSLQADTLVKRAVEALKRNQPDSAAQLHQQALNYFKSKGHLIAWIQSHVKLAYAWSGPLDQPFIGLDLIDRALLSPFRTPQNRFEWEQLSLTYQAKAFIYEEYVGDFMAAKTQYEQGFQIFIKQLGEKSDRIASYLYYKYGNLCTRLGDYERAQNIHQRGINYSQKYNLPAIAKYGDLAIVLIELDKNEAALKVIAEGLSRSGASSEATITLRRSEAKAYFNLGNIEVAKQKMAQIPPLIKQLKVEGSQTDEAYYWSGYYELLAAIQEKTGHAAQAVSLLQKAVQFEKQSWGTSERREVGKLYSLLGDVYQRLDKPKEALNEYQLALTCVIPHFKPKSAEEHPDKSQFFPENTILEALEGKARAFRALGQLNKALECYELIPVVETKLRATHAYESSSLLALNESRLRFDEAVEIAWQLYAQTSQISYAERAFRLTEQARGMLLLQSLSEAQASYKLPENIRRQEEKLNGKLVWYDGEIAAERDAGSNGNAARLAQLEKELLDLKQENEKFKAELRRQFPEYAALSDEIRFLQVADVPGLLRNNQLLIDFYLTEKNAFVFAFDPQGNFSWRRTELPAGFRENVKRWVEYLQKGDEDDQPGAAFFRQQAYELFALLLAPELQKLLPQTGSLMLIPDDALVFVPFEVLLTQPAPSGNWRDLPWLLAGYNTGYAYSATLLQMQQTISRRHREQNSAPKYQFGGFSATYSSPDIYQPVGTEPLVRNTRKMLGGKIWHNHRCNEASFKKSAPDCRVLLLAMHGKADAENPALSRFLFGDPGPDSLENNNELYAGELQIMRLQADLAVLSACYSGFGKLHHGEGVFSLARAFTRAGVPATVMSLWLLQDNTPGPLLQSFFQYLQAGKSKDEALRLAKLDFIKNDEYFAFSHPTYWASLTTTGDMCALELPKPAAFPWWWPAGLLLLILGSVFAWRLRKRR